jgi:hypothetical protein
LLLGIFSLLGKWTLRNVRVVSKKWCNIANGLVYLKFPYHGCEQNAAEFLLLAPSRLPLEISSSWYPLKRKDQLDTMLDQFDQLESISLIVKRSYCPRCSTFPDTDLDHLESTLFWRICELIEGKKIRLKSLTFAPYSLGRPSANIVAKLGENFPAQYRCLEELTLPMMTEDGGIGNLYKFNQSCRGLKKLRIEMVSLWFPSDISWEDLSHLQLRIQRISGEDLQEFTAFLRRHKRLKRIVLYVKRLQNDQVEDDQQRDDQQRDDQQEGDEQEQLIKEILAMLRDIDHDVRIVDTFDRNWAE